MSLAAPPDVSYGHLMPVPVHFDDLDAMGILHNARYALLIERALITWWSARGHSYNSDGPTTPDSFNVVREYSITFHAPVRGTGEIAVHFWLERLGSTSAEYRFRFVSADGGTLFAEGRRINVRLDPATMRPAPWTEAARTASAELLRIP